MAWCLTITVMVPADELQSCFESLARMLPLLAKVPFIYLNPIKVMVMPITPYHIPWLWCPFWSMNDGLHHEGNGILGQLIDHVGHRSIFGGGF